MTCAGQEVDDETGTDDEQRCRERERANSTHHPQPYVVLDLAFQTVKAMQSVVQWLDVKSPQRKETESQADDRQHGDDAAHAERRRQTSDLERQRHGQESLQRDDYS